MPRWKTQGADRRAAPRPQTIISTAHSPSLCDHLYQTGHLDGSLDRSFGERPIVRPGDGSEARGAALRLAGHAENVDGYNAFEHIRGLAKEILGVEQER